MTLLFVALLIFSTYLIVRPIHAQSGVNALAGCMVNHMNGKERKGLAGGALCGITAHLGIKLYFKVASDDTQSSDQFTGALTSRLLTKDCPNEHKAANGPAPLVLQPALEFMGQLRSKNPWPIKTSCKPSAITPSTLTQKKWVPY